MNARMQRTASRVVAVAVLSVAVLAASAIDARAACMVPGPRNPSAGAATAKLAALGKPPVLAAAAQNGNSNGGGPIVGQWQIIMTASPGTPNEFVFDFAFQQFHADGTELMISGGVPPTIGNVCIGVWERGAGGLIHVRHMTWNWAGNEVLGDLPTGYFWLEVTLRPNQQGTAYSGTWRTGSYDLGTGPLGSGGAAQPGTEFDGTVQAVRISAQ